VVTTIANTAANRRFTFAVTGPGAARNQLQGLLVFGVGWAISAGSLALLALVSADPPRLVEVAVLIIANLTATVGRFVAMRSWMFPSRKGST
jgi:putative flippase GtrA